MSDDKTNENGVSRRQVLIGTGALAAGAAVSSPSQPAGREVLSPVRNQGLSHDD